MTTSRTFVLVHGAWHGGWCWRFVRDELTARGHRVHAPSLTGLGERSHLLSNAITLQTHIDDVVNLLRWEDLDDVVLVAHSYGGWPVSGALETALDRVRAVVFVDAYMPEDGQRVPDLNSAQFRQKLFEAIERGEPGRPVPDVANFGILDPQRAAWVQAHMTPQPTGPSLHPIRLTGARERVPRKAYVRAASYPQPHLDACLARTQADPSWRTWVFAPHEAGHDVMVDAPEWLAAILEEIAA